MKLQVNGTVHELDIEPDMPLLWALRDELNIKGPKFGCGAGLCGACTVIVDGRAMYACLLLAIDCEGREIRTIEGVAQGDALAPLQQAFIEHDAFQCGFCTSGQIMILRALLDAHPNASEEQIRTAVSGNICRCGAYPNIVAAGKRAAELMRENSTAAGSASDHITMQAGGR